MKIKNLIFDLGGVIIQQDSEHNQKFLSWYYNIPLKQAYQLWNNGDSLVKGEETTEEFLNRIEQFLNKKFDLQETKKSWRKFYAKTALINKQLLSLIDKLKDKYNIYILTDAEKIHNDNPLKKGLYNKFDQVFKSYEEGIRKPHKKAYLNVLNNIQAKPEECIFIDDKEENVDGANKVGIKGVVYINLEQLKHKLTGLNIS